MIDFEITWEDAEISTPHKASMAVVRACSFARPATMSTSSNTVHKLVESFCLSAYYVVVSYDSIPILSASVAVSLPRPLRSRGQQFSKPARLHYGFSVTHTKQWSGTPRDSYFSCATDDGLSFQADFDIKACEVNVLGLPFVIQLEDGSWLKNNFDEDFYVGGGDRTIPCAVEVPFSNPLDMEISDGQMLSLHRTSPFWLQPSFGGDGLHSCRQETQFVLYSVSMSRDPSNDGQGGDEKKFVVLLPVIDRASGIRASIFSVEESKYPAIRLETGSCAPLHLSDLDSVKACVATFADDAYDAVRSAVDVTSSLMETYSSRSTKISSRKWGSIISSERGVLSSLGYCTWDAYGHEVCESVTTQALRWLSAEGISLGYIIIDDGWQAGGDAGPNFELLQDSGTKTGRPRLSSFRANKKFSHSLGNFARTLDVEVVAWVAIIGYWGGTSGFQCDVKTFHTRGALSSGLHQNEVEDTAFWEKEYEVIDPCANAVEMFFERYFVHSMAWKQGVSGVKVDAQSILEILCNPKSPLRKHGSITRTSITATYRAAVTKAVERAFPNSIVINSMACGPETIFSSGKQVNRGNICWRTSNDHAFPGVEECAESVSWHILCNAMTSVFLGEVFPVVDWDMFRASDRFAHIHACARVLSGGPIYFSDASPFTSEHSEKATVLLKALTTHDGRVHRCQSPGRPTLDCLFTDPRWTPTRLFKIFNRTSVLGLLGVFNLDASENSQIVSGYFEPADIEDFARLQGRRQYLSLVTGSITRAFLHQSLHHRCEVSLSSMSAALVHICPIFQIAGNIKFAILGQPHLLNAGATLASISIGGSVSLSENDEKCSLLPSSSRTTVECLLFDHGVTYIWFDEFSEQLLEKMTTLNGQEVGYSSVQIDEIRFCAVQVPPSAPWGIQLLFSTQTG